MRANPWIRFKDMKISAKLGLGFGAFVLLALLVAASSYVGSRAATNKINLTGSVRMPVALTASQAQTDLLRMMSELRGYLALGDREYWDNYLVSDRAFRADLAALEELKPDFDALNAARFDQLKSVYAEWSALPDRLYRLRNDQLEREPAYRLLATDGVRSAGRVLIDMNSLIDAPREASSQSVTQLQEMAQFEASFAAMLSALRGYTTTRNRIFRQEYEVNRAANDISWEQVWGKRDSLPADQQLLLGQVRESRQAFLALPDQIFPLLESDRWREDLYLFRAEALPLTDRMNGLLGEMTSDQQTQLVTDLDDGRRSLAAANRQIIAAGVVAVLIGLVLAFVSRARIAAPIRRLTAVAERIQGGDLAAQARVESRDEIGILARTFNSMTGQLRATLTQVRKEKTRADSLLNVVIPLGVQLSSEKDFNLLLERTVVEAKTFCHADGGLLYLRTDEGMLKPVIVRYDPRGVALGGATGGPVDRPAVPLTAPAGEGQMCPIPVQVALSGRSLNLDLSPGGPYGTVPSQRPPVGEDGSQRGGAQAAGYDLGLETAEIGGAGPASVLAIPLVNNAGVVLGVLELLDAVDPEGGRPIPFDANLQQMMESFSSLAVAALEAYIREQSLRQEIRQLRIEIDEVKRQQEVSEIVETDFFQDLQARARAMRGPKSPPLASE
jgi:CHASE3 domain sensor protein